MYVCVLGTSILPLSMNFLLDFGTVPTVWHRGNQERTIQRHRQRSAHKTQDEDKQSKKHGTESYKCWTSLYAHIHKSTIRH
jgi:hypothetical protein